jgi:3-hydroxy-D-aspartate aldolase
MPQKPPAAPGQNFAEADTPALVIDLDAFERNLDWMAAFGRQAGIAIRPHAKSHKSPEIARRQIALGASGQCCQKVSEAEVLVDGGVGNVLVTNEIVGRAKLARLAALADRARIGICIDDPAAVTELAMAAAESDAQLDVYLEIDVGQARCGIVAGEPAARLAQAVAKEKHLRFAGLQAYHGAAQHARTLAERKDKIGGAVTRVKETLAALKAAGLDCPSVTGAGTGTYEIEAASGVYTELQPGSYVFMDADYGRNLDAAGQPFRTFENALFVAATVMSATAPERAVVDAGHKALAIDSGMPEPWALAGVRYHRPSDEHGVLDLTQCNNRPRRGNRVLLVPGHCDPTVNLHDWYVGVRGLHTPQAVVEALWPVAARGALF